MSIINYKAVGPFRKLHELAPRDRLDEEATIFFLSQTRFNCIVRLSCRAYVCVTPVFFFCWLDDVGIIVGNL